MKAQGSLELLLLFAGALIALSVVVAVLPSEAIGSQAIREKEIAKSSASIVANAADEVYLAGDGASQYVWVDMPESTNFNGSFIGAPSYELNWSKRKTTNINVLSEGDMSAGSHAPICGKWPSTPGRHRIKVAYNATGTAHVAINDNC
ncbi:MAG: class III signal peptide-containing protein [Candidatus Micrarchaeia archaeon]